MSAVHYSSAFMAWRTWWHDYVMGAAEIRFIRGRLDFGGERKSGHNAPFPSCVVVWR